MRPRESADAGSPACGSGAPRGGADSAVLTGHQSQVHNPAACSCQDGHRPQEQEQEQELGSLHLSSRRDSRSHATIRVIRRQPSRRHMTGDHRGPPAGGTVTLLLTAMDGILGTHGVQRETMSVPETLWRCLCRHGVGAGDDVARLVVVVG